MTSFKLNLLHVPLLICRVRLNIVCCAFNHQNNIEMGQGHISLSKGESFLFVCLEEAYIYIDTHKISSFWEEIIVVSRNGVLQKKLANIHA
jgi:hypothetical protein